MNLSLLGFLRGKPKDRRYKHGRYVGKKKKGLPADTKAFYTNYKEPLKLVKDGYGYEGTLAADETGNHLQCHICGMFFEQLASHIYHTHSLKAREYKKKFGLAQSSVLMGERIRSKLIASGQRQSPRLVEMQKKANGMKRDRSKQSRKNSWSLERRNRDGTCPDQLLDKIRDLTKKLGKPPTLKQFRKEYGNTFHYAINSTFGNWTKALAITGYKTHLKSHDRQGLMMYMRIFYREHGRTPTNSDMRRGLLPVAKTYRRYWQSLNEARLAAGVPTIEHRGKIVIEVPPEDPAGIFNQEVT